MTDAHGSASAPAGWYPDPSGSGGQRWWDGTSWSDHTAPAAQGPAYGAQAPTAQQPYGQQQYAAQPYSLNGEHARTPEGASMSTAPIWLIVLLPIVSLLFLPFYDWNGLITEAVAAADPDAPLIAPTTDPAQLLSTVFGWVLYAATVLLAVWDYRVLRSRGVSKPFHWAYAFIPTQLVYVIGRSVVVARRGRPHWAPMWASIAITVASFIVGIVIFVAIFSATFDQFSGAY